MRGEIGNKRIKGWIDAVRGILNIKVKEEIRDGEESLREEEKGSRGRDRE